MCKLGLRTCNSQKRNIQMRLRLQCIKRWPIGGRRAPFCVLMSLKGRCPVRRKPTPSVYHFVLAFNNSFFLVSPSLPFYCRVCGMHYSHDYSIPPIVRLNFSVWRRISRIFLITTCSTVCTIFTSCR
jgi:hypothetical protein